MNEFYEKDFSLRVSNVSKIYHTYSNPRHRLLEILSRGKKSYARETKALDDVSFTLEKSGRLGIIGDNGSGKSTILKILAGVLTPTSGSVQVNGRISALLELGAGFNPILTGKENIRQFCMLHGMASSEIDEALPEIINFSELRDAIDHPVKTYSSGMAVRLGFACAVYVKPDILIVDEALSVGDAYFQNKCLHKIKSLLDCGTSFIYVTHAADSIRSLCSKGLWLSNGKVRSFGTSADVGSQYQAEVYRRSVHVTESNNLSFEKINQNETSSNDFLEIPNQLRQIAFEDRVRPLRSGSGEVRILDIVLINENGAETDNLKHDESITIRIVFSVIEAPVNNSAITIGITDSSGKEVCHFNSLVHGICVSNFPINHLQAMDFTFDNQLCPGEYGVVAGVGVMEPHPAQHGRYNVRSVIDYCVGGVRFTVQLPNNPINDDLWGVFRLNYSVKHLVS